jgi:pimeloyl-ACP methyl ester carboxylesterase/DNA-binding CsgD family transcriptional regulator
MDQEIRFCSSADGVRIAYAKVGKGPPIVRVGTFLTHLEYDWRSPVWRPWLDNFSRFHTLYRYDARGCGLSDWEVDDFSLEVLMGDLEAVVDAAGLERFTLFGMSQGGGVGIWYASRHPERVSHLIIYGGYLQGAQFRGPESTDYQKHEIWKKLFKLAWATDNPAYRQVFTTSLLPEGTSEQIKWLNDLQRLSTSPENAVRLSDGYSHIDVLKEASSLSVPTLVLHARDDVTIGFDEGRKMAAHIPNALFVPLESKNHILLPSENAWGQFWQHVYSFLNIPENLYREQLQHASKSSLQTRFAELSLREREVLHLVVQGYRNDQIANVLVLSPKTIRNYISRIFAKLNVSSRGEAIILAKDSGFGQLESK